MAFNADRTIANPNSLWDGERLYVFDHGMIAPIWTATVDDMTAGSLYGEPNVRLHAGRRSVRGAPIDWRALCDTWGNVVTPRLLAWISELIPTSWAKPGDVRLLVEFLTERANMVGLQAEQLRGLCA